MWPALFIIALIPLFFFWSDSALTFFPQMAEYLPAKMKAEDTTPAPATNPDDPAFVPPENTHWTEQDDENGYAAWAMSLDGIHRIAVGCQTGQGAAISITSLQNTAQGVNVQNPTDTSAILNYSFGVLPAPRGYYTGEELVNAVAQFGESVALQNSEGTVTYARFKVDPYTSQTIARQITQKCG